MDQRAWRLSLVIFAALSCTSAFGEDKIVVLKNGRRIQGELVEENAASLVVKTSGGQLTLDRSGVLRVEEIPKSKPFLEPSAGNATPSSPSKSVDEARPPESSGSISKAPAAPQMSSTPAYAAAPAAVVSDCMRMLGEVAQARDYQRSALLKEVVKKCGLDPLVTILAEPSRANESAERLAVRELARDGLKDAGGAARVSLTRAAIGTRFMSQDVLRLLEDLFDNSVEDATLAALRDFEPSSQRLAVEMLARHGTRRSAATLADLALTVSDEVDQLLPRAVGQALAAIAGRDHDPRSVIGPLARKVERAEKLPSGFALDGILVALAAIPSEGLDALKRIASGLGHEQARMHDDDPKLPTLNYRLASTYRALASTGEQDGLDVVEAAITDSTDASHRQLWIRCLASATRSGDNAKFIRWLIAWWDKHDEDGEAIAEVLGATTGKSFGPALGAWRDYADSLR